MTSSSQMSEASAGASSVYSLTQHHDKKKRSHLKKQKAPKIDSPSKVDPIIEEKVESENNFEETQGKNIH